MDEEAKPTKTALEKLHEAGRKQGVKVDIVELQPGTGTVTFLGRRNP